MSASSLSLTARWIVPVDSPPVEHARLVIEDGRIAAIEQVRSRSVHDVDYADAVILPGFINAHTHLELTGFRGCVPFDGSFTQWLRDVVTRQTDAGAEQIMLQGLRDGLQQSLAAGVTTIVDIGCGPRALAQWPGSPAQVVGLFEAIGMGPRRYEGHPRTITAAIEHCDAYRGRARLRGRVAGLSPHAPYSTAPDVYRQAVDYAVSHHLPLGTHVAETLDELQFLVDGAGPFRELLEERGAWDGSFAPPGCSPVEYMRRLGLLDTPAMLAHVNYVTDADLDLLAASRCSVVYCPRTHAFFRHPPHPFTRMLARGINVCLGTDSLAGNSTLSILDELRLLHALHPAMSPPTLIDLATVNGARACGLLNQCGSLSPGKRADLCIIPVASGAARDALQAVLEGDAGPLATYVDGCRVDAGPAAMSQ